jgi:hypothetical protein
VKKKVDLFIVGAQKCATSTVHKIIESHADVVGPADKEIHFFSTCENWRGQLQEYKESFEWQEGKLHFERSTSYTFYPHRNLAIWEKIYEYNDDAKILYCVRNPVDRIVSGYMHDSRRGRIDCTVDEYAFHRSLVLDITRYTSQILPYMQQFGPDQVKIIFFKDIANRATRTATNIANFLELDPGQFTTDPGAIHANKSLQTHDQSSTASSLDWIKKNLRPLFRRDPNRPLTERPSLSHDSALAITYMLRNEIAELEELTGRNLDSWRVGETNQP